MQVLEFAGHLARGWVSPPQKGHDLPLGEEEGWPEEALAPEDCPSLLDWVPEGFELLPPFPNLLTFWPLNRFLSLLAHNQHLSIYFPNGLFGLLLEN